MRIALVAFLIVACSKSAPPSTSSSEPVMAKPAPQETGVDGMKYLPKEGLPRTLPPNAPKDLWERVKVSSIRILATDEDIAKRVKLDEFGMFLDLTLVISQTNLGLSTKANEVSIRVDCAIGKHTVKIDGKDPVDPKIVEYLHQDLDGMPPLEVKGDLAFVVNIHVADPAVYENWMDGKKYQADWETYKPQGGAPPPDPNQKVQLQYVRLLTTQDDVAKYTTAQELATFVKAIQANAEKTIGTLGKSVELMLQMKCTPKGHTAQIASKNEPDEKVVQKLYDAIKTMTPLRTTGDVEFMLHFVVVP